MLFQALAMASTSTLQKRISLSLGLGLGPVAFVWLWLGWIVNVEAADRPVSSHRSVPLQPEAWTQTAGETIPKPRALRDHFRYAIGSRGFRTSIFPTISIHEDGDLKSSSKKALQKADALSRRKFLQTAGVITAATIVPRHILGGPGFTPPSEKLNIAVIGTGGRGKRLIKGIFRYDDARIVAIADPTAREDYSRFYYRGVSGRQPVKEIVETHYSARYGARETCSDYEDYRELLDKEKGVDAVMIATPDHVHAFVTLAALRLGKHVYCEKPLTHSVQEARVVTEEARKAEVATQMGQQGNSGEGIRQCCEWVWDGAIGEVREVHAWSGAGGWLPSVRERPKDTPLVPRGMNWDLWLGPATARPYHPHYAPYNWRGWWDFGTGGIGDMGCHNIDPAMAALKLIYPDTVEGTSTKLNDERTPYGTLIHFTFPEREGMPPVRLTWYGGGMKPPRPEEFAPGQNFGGEGCLLVGSKGKILLGGWSRHPRLLPELRMQEYKQPPKTLLRVSAHDRAWLDACKGGPKASSDFDYSGPLAELVLLGMVAVRCGEKLHWDGPNMRATNCAEAAKYVSQQYRRGWSLS